MGLRPPNLCWTSTHPGIEAWTSCWSAHVAPRHSHDAYQVSLTRSGLGRFNLDELSFTGTPEGLVLIEPGESHEAAPISGSTWEFDTLYLDRGVFRGMIGRFDPSPPPRRFERSDGRLLAAFSRLHRAVVRGSPAVERDDLVVVFSSLLGGLVAERPHTKPSKAALVRVREYLDECPVGDLTLSDLATLADLSPSHLSRSFRRAFGIPPHAYLVQARVHRARDLLRRGMPIVEVAAVAGFADQAHLTRHFRRLVGVTPGTYRSMGRIVQDRPDSRPLS